MTTRRRVLRGLSAASVASALPLFVSRGSAQRASARHAVRVALVPRSSVLEFAVHLRATSPFSILQGDFRVPSGELRWSGGRRAATPALEGQFLSSRAPQPRRLPRAMTLTLAEGEEGWLGVFVVDPGGATPREARFDVEVAGERYPIDWIALDAVSPSTGAPLDGV